MIEIEKRRAGKDFRNEDKPMSFKEATRLLNGSILVMRMMGWAWRWSEWWVDYNFNWEPLLEPGQNEKHMTKAELKIVDSTRESRCQDARRCRLAAFGAALRNRNYDTCNMDDVDFDGEFDNESLEQALRAILCTESLVGPLEKYEVDFFVEWLGRAYRSKSRLLGFGDDKIEIGEKAARFCFHKADDTPKFELGTRPLPGRAILKENEIFEVVEEVDDFLCSIPVNKQPVAPVAPVKVGDKKQTAEAVVTFTSSRTVRKPEVLNLAREPARKRHKRNNDGLLVTEEEVSSSPMKGKPGRPPKRERPTEMEDDTPVKRKRGRPPVKQSPVRSQMKQSPVRSPIKQSSVRSPMKQSPGPKPKRGRGRSPKSESENLDSSKHPPITEAKKQTTLLAPLSSEAKKQVTLLGPLSPEEEKIFERLKKKNVEKRSPSDKEKLGMFYHRKEAQHSKVEVQLDPSKEKEAVATSGESAEKGDGVERPNADSVTKTEAEASVTIESSEKGDSVQKTVSDAVKTVRPRRSERCVTVAPENSTADTAKEGKFIQMKKQGRKVLSFSSSQKSHQQILNDGKPQQQIDNDSDDSADNLPISAAAAKGKLSPQKHFNKDRATSVDQHDDDDDDDYVNNSSSTNDDSDEDFIGEEEETKQKARGRKAKKAKTTTTTTKKMKTSTRTTRSAPAKKTKKQPSKDVTKADNDVAPEEEEESDDSDLPISQLVAARQKIKEKQFQDR